MGVLAMLVSAIMDILVLATMARGLLMLSLKPRLMLLFFMEDMDMVVMDLDIPVLVILVSLLILVLATMARGLLMLSLKPMLHISMVDTDVDMLVLDMLDMEVMVLDMAVGTIMVK